MDNDLKKISELLENYVNEHNFSKKINDFKLFDYWTEIVGKDVSAHAKPKRLKNKALYISVSDSIWANELSIMSQSIIEKINNYLCDEVVNELRIKCD